MSSQSPKNPTDASLNIQDTSHFVFLVERCWNSPKLSQLTCLRSELRVGRSRLTRRELLSVCFVRNTSIVIQLEIPYCSFNSLLTQQTKATSEMNRESQATKPSRALQARRLRKGELLCEEIQVHVTVSLTSETLEVNLMVTKYRKSSNRGSSREAS